MKVNTILATSALAGLALAHPLAKREDIDVTVLQFALTLEHLENVFYKEAISKLSEQDFKDAGYSAKYYSDLCYIAHDEESHVTALTSALSAAGATPVEACTYDFPFTDVKSFITLSSVLEGVGTSAYLGGAPLITSKDYLTVAGSILVAEALHTSMQRSALNQVPSPNPYGTPLSPSPVYTLAASFIASCPDSNAALPFTAFPTLTAVQGTPAAPGIPFEFSIEGDIPQASYVTWVSGLAVTSEPVTDVSGKNFMAMVPATAMGQTYALLTNANVTTVDDSAVLAGPAVIEVTPPSPTFDVNVL
ncbi:putative protein rds1 [Phaeomoniella chlamydospora]|uniref:Uncharacterized protein n=1 Tax=Phaeomoniella chlamydospora TaxID=158046 RepID=A0A0G2EDA6_PHACM|nr:putative protein rds1 [Phaeomoniella chlamydospora]